MLCNYKMIWRRREKYLAYQAGDMVYGSTKPKENQFGFV